MIKVNLTQEEIDMIITWLGCYEPFPGDSKSKVEREERIIENIKEKLK